MPKKKVQDPADFIVPLNMNGMQGRMLVMPRPARKQREILLVYGHHASIERMAGLAEELNKYGGVTLPDLPGFGGMESFAKIGKAPTLENLADYLASFMKLRYKRQKVVIAGMSFGFAVVTRMLQKYPDLTPKVEFVVSIAGVVHKDEFALKKHTMLELDLLTRVLQHRPGAWWFKHFILRPAFIRLTYKAVADKHVKLKASASEERERLIAYEIKLWQINDVRTHGSTTQDMFNLDLCGQHVDLPAYHVAVDNDRYFNNDITEQHLEVIYSKVTMIRSTIVGHAPTIVATAKDAAPFVPPKLRRVLSKL